MDARVGAPDARALLAGSARVRAAVPRIIEAAAPEQRVALVGGVVRDLLRGAEPREVDVVVEGDGIAFAERLGALIGAPVRAYPAFGTATVSGRPPIDVASARCETYPTPGALPTVAPATLEQDLLRRDVTVNAIAAVIAGGDAGTLLDPTGGVEDVRAGRLRLVRADSFMEDPTRLVRVARYAERLSAAPDAPLEAAARAAVQAGAVSRISTARMVDAVARVFEEARPGQVIARLAAWDVLEAIESGLAGDPVAMDAAWAIVEDEARDADRVALGVGLLLGGVEPDRRRAWLTAGGLERAPIRAALAVADADALRARIAGAPEADDDAACARVPIEAVVAVGGPEAIAYLGRLRHIELAVDGDDVRRAAGIEGPDVGRALVALRRARIEGVVASEREVQLAWLGAWTA